MKSKGLSENDHSFVADSAKLDSNSSATEQPQSMFTNLKFRVIRCIRFPFPWIPRSAMLIGGKQLVEILVIAVFVALSIVAGLVFDAKSVGSLSSFCGGIAIFCIIRTSVFGVSILWHKVFSVLLVILGIFHGVREDSIATGVLLITLLCCTSGLYLLATINFDLFYHIHIVLFWIIAIVAMAHGAVFLFVAFLVWLLDVVLRYFVYHKEVSVAVTQLSHTNIIMILFPKSDFRNYGSAQYCCLRCRQVNRYEYHPFTIASSPLESNMMFFVRNSGDWTEKLNNTLYRIKSTPEGSSEGRKLLSMGIEGPYGGLSVDIFNRSVYEAVILVGGGIGITALLSIYRHFQMKIRCNGPSGDHIPKRIFVIWSVRNSTEAKQLFIHGFQEFVGEGLDNVNVSNFQKNTGVGENSNSSAFTLFSSFLPSILKKKSSPYVENTSYSPLRPAMFSRKEKDDNNKILAKEASDVEVSETDPCEYHFHLSSVADPHNKVISLPNAKLWNYGRPNLPSIFQSASQYVVKNCTSKRVGVVVCGPSSLVCEVRDLCDRSLIASVCDSHSAIFDCHEESFCF